jgi:hypothetical protein
MSNDCFSDSNLVRHAKRELELAGFFKSCSDYGGDIAPAVLELIRVFSSQRHSGGSASMTRSLFTRLSNFKVLSEITSDEQYWISISDIDDGLWQSTRQSSIFSTDGGRTYYDIDEPGRPIHVSRVRE